MQVSPAAPVSRKSSFTSVPARVARPIIDGVSNSSCRPVNIAVVYGEPARPGSGDEALVHVASVEVGSCDGVPVGPVDVVPRDRMPPGELLKPEMKFSFTRYRSAWPRRSSCPRGSTVQVPAADHQPVRAGGTGDEAVVDVRTVEVRPPDVVAGAVPPGRPIDVAAVDRDLARAGGSGDISSRPRPPRLRWHGQWSCLGCPGPLGWTSKESRHKPLARSAQTHR